MYIFIYVYIYSCLLYIIWHTLYLYLIDIWTCTQHEGDWTMLHTYMWHISLYIYWLPMPVVYAYYILCDLALILLHVLYLYLLYAVWSYILLWWIIGALGMWNLAYNPWQKLVICHYTTTCIHTYYMLYGHAIGLTYKYYRNGQNLGSKIGRITYNCYCNSPHITYIYRPYMGIYYAL